MAFFYLFIDKISQFAMFKKIHDFFPNKKVVKLVEFAIKKKEKNPIYFVKKANKGLLLRGSLISAFSLHGPMPKNN